MALPGWIKPQLTKLVDRPPDGPKWLHEIKFDGGYSRPETSSLPRRSFRWGAGCRSTGSSRVTILPTSTAPPLTPPRALDKAGALFRGDNGAGDFAGAFRTVIVSCKPYLIDANPV
jgi:hypothetical protein